MKRRVMVVEDDPDLRPTLTDLLSEAGYEVLEACDGRDALGKLRQEPPPDVILLDLMMPRMDGWQFRVEQKRDPRLAGTPVIVVSADSSYQARAVDAQRFLSKPLDTADLLAALESVVPSSEEQQADSEARLLALESVAGDLVRHMRPPLDRALKALEALEYRLAIGSLIGARGKQEALQLIRDARASDVYVKRLIDDLDTFAGGGNGVRTRVDLRSVVEAALAMTFSRLHHNARIKCDFGSASHVLADQPKLLAIVVHILVNAVQALPDDAEAGGDVNLHIRRSGRGLVVIEITDNGWGMMPSVKRRAFDPFFTTLPGRRAGLGLALCRGILRSMGGRIECESTFGRGTSVRLLLPAAD